VDLLQSELPDGVVLDPRAVSPTFAAALPADLSAVGAGS